MPPRYAYWTILAGGLPTAFRVAERDELLPTFRRIQEKHPDAEMKYFARGRLWESREAAQAFHDMRAANAARRPEGERRGRDWRPGGEHRDPRQKFKDAKRDRNRDQRQERFARKTRAPRPAGSAPAPPSSPRERSGPAPRGRGPGTRVPTLARPPGGRGRRR
jgi:hypothetical protein